MNKYETPDDGNSLSRREMLTSMATTIVIAMTGGLVTHRSFAQQSSNNNEMNIMGNVFPEAFVYSELQISLPFDQAPWRDINKKLKWSRGLLSKTWLLPFFAVSCRRHQARLSIPKYRSVCLSRRRHGGRAILY